MLKTVDLLLIDWKNYPNKGFLIIQILQVHGLMKKIMELIAKKKKK